MMDVFKLCIAGFVSLIPIGEVNAKPFNPTEYTIPFFENHDDKRQATIRFCRDDYQLHADKVWGAICQNAETAEDRIYRKRQNQGLNVLNTIKWWKENPSTRKSALIGCQRRAIYDRQFLPYCKLARDAENDIGIGLPRS